MFLHQNLEQLLSDSYVVTTCQQRTEPSALRGYLIDTSASWLYWTPVMAAVEFGTGLSSKQVFYSRAIGLLTSVVLARPLGKFREYWSEQCKTDSDSSWIRKYVTDTAGWCLQVPLYSLQLYISGVTSLENVIKSLAGGLGTTAVLGRPYGYFLDFWRKKFGAKPVLSK